MELSGIEPDRDAPSHHGESFLPVQLVAQDEKVPETRYGGHLEEQGRVRSGDFFLGVVRDDVQVISVTSPMEHCHSIGDCKCDKEGNPRAEVRLHVVIYDEGKERDHGAREEHKSHDGGISDPAFLHESGPEAKWYGRTEAKQVQFPGHGVLLHWISGWLNISSCSVVKSAGIECCNRINNFSLFVKLLFF